MTPVESVERIEERLRDIAAGACGCGLQDEAELIGIVFDEYRYQRWAASVRMIFCVEHAGESFSEFAKKIHAELTAREKEK